MIYFPFAFEIMKKDTSSFHIIKQKKILVNNYLHAYRDAGWLRFIPKKINKEYNMIIVIVQRSCRDEKNHKRNKNPIEILVSMTKAYFFV